MFLRTAYRKYSTQGKETPSTKVFHINKKRKAHLLKHPITVDCFVIPPLHSHLALGLMTWFHLLFPTVSLTTLFN